MVYSIFKSAIASLSVSAVFASGVVAAPIPITGETLRAAEHDPGASAVSPVATMSSLDVAGVPASSSSYRHTDRVLVEEIGDGGIASVRTPVGYARANARGEPLGTVDAFDAGNPFRTDFFTHWNAERGEINALGRFGRPVDPSALGGFGFYGDAIYAAHGRFTPMSESGLDNNGVSGWFVGGWNELADFIGVFDRIGGGSFEHHTGGRFDPVDTGGRVVVIPLPGPAAMTGVGLLLLASRRRR